LNSIDAFRHFLSQRVALNRSHLLELVKRCVESFVDTSNHLVTQTTPRRLQCTGQTRNEIDIQISGDIEFGLHFAQSVYIARY